MTQLFHPAATQFLSWGIVVAFVVIGFSIAVRRHKNSMAGIPTLNSAIEKHSFKLIDRIQIAEHVIRLRFALPSSNHVLGLAIGKHVMASAMISCPLSTSGELKSVGRQYTPISSDFSDTGYFDLVVKVYRKNQHPGFPAGGLMSQYLDALPLGSSVDFKGPNGRVEYLEKGRFRIGKMHLKANKIAMIAGGTGVAPMFQLIRHLEETRQGRDNFQLSLLFGNQHPGDILLREELEAFKRLRLTMTVDRVEPGETWNGYIGFVSPDMIKASIPAPSPDLVVFICGPPPMVRSVENHLQGLGYDKTRVHAF